MSHPSGGSSPVSSILEALRDALLISSIDRHFAKEMGRLGGEDRPLALAAIALASRETALGHTCLAIERLTRADAWGDVSMMLNEFVHTAKGMPRSLQIA